MRRLTYEMLHDEGTHAAVVRVEVVVGMVLAILVLHRLLMHMNF